MIYFQGLRIINNKEILLIDRIGYLDIDLSFTTVIKVNESMINIEFNSLCDSNFASKSNGFESFRIIEENKNG
jgi:hypothetical protein